MWQVLALSAEAAQRNLQDPPRKAYTDGRSAEEKRDKLWEERDRLPAKPPGEFAPERPPQEIDFDDELRQAANVSFKKGGGGGAMLGSHFSSCVQTEKHKC